MVLKQVYFKKTVFLISTLPVLFLFPVVKIVKHCLEYVRSMTFKYTYCTIWQRSLYDLCSIFQTYYRLKIGAFHGTIPDNLSYHKGHPFSTKDRDNDSNGGSCATMYKGGWWYNKCHYSNLNGINYGYEKSYSNSMCWSSIGNYGSLKSIKMAIRPR